MDWTWKIKETGMSLWVNKFRIQYCNKFEKRFSLEYIQWLPQFVFPWGKVFFNFLRVQLQKGNVRKKKKNTNLVFFSRHMSQNAYIFYTRCFKIILHNLMTGEGGG